MICYLPHLISLRKLDSFNFYLINKTSLFEYLVRYLIYDIRYFIFHIISFTYDILILKAKSTSCNFLTLNRKTGISGS